MRNKDILKILKRIESISVNEEIENLALLLIEDIERDIKLANYMMFFLVGLVSGIAFYILWILLLF